MKQHSPLFTALTAHRRTMGSLLSVVLVANMFVLVQRSVAPSPDGSLVASGNDPTGTLVNPDGSLTPAGKKAAKKAARAAEGGASPVASPKTDVRAAAPGTVIKGKGRVPFGIDGNELTVVYYWKGDQTKSSPFLAGTGQEGNVDEGEAFTNLIKFINMHADGGELMGYHFNLHGWKLKPIVLEAGKGDDQIRAAEKIASEIKPFAAVSSHGSISAYVCPRLAKAGIFNISTYDLDWDLYGRTNGYCLPQGLSWDAQVDIMTAYLKDRAETVMYQNGATSEKPVFGLLYAEYPGLVDSGPVVAKRLKAAGIPLAEVATVDPDLTTAGRQQPGVIAKFRGAGVNTIIAPDSGSLITFTHAAQAAGYAPDYAIWPCSGEDSMGMVRLYNAAQWARASGLTCYDPHLNADLTNDDMSRKTEWYKAYQEAAPGDEPPAPTSLVYQSLLPLVAGITYAGRDLTIERFNEGLKQVKPFRYDAIEGVTNDPSNILVTMNAADGSQVGDAAKVYWDPSTKTAGNATPGTYAFPENRRYRRGQSF